MRLVAAHQSDEDHDGFSRLVPLDEIRAQQHNLSIPLYVRSESANGNGKAENGPSLREAIATWQTSSRDLRLSMDDLFETLEEAGLGK